MIQLQVRTGKYYYTWIPLAFWSFPSMSIGNAEAAQVPLHQAVETKFAAARHTASLFPILPKWKEKTF